MARKSRTPRAPAIYVRISKDDNGDGLAVDRQVKLCRELVGRKGWPDADVYSDDGISAYNGKRRPAFERLLADVEAGARDAIVVVDLDRLYRRTRELVRLIDVCERLDVALANVSGDVDLSTSDGRFQARIMGAVAEQESEKKSERQRREREQAASRGVAHGGRRPFGYEREGGGRLRVVEAEAELVREAAARWLNGESLRALARDFESRDVRALATTIGLRTVLVAPRIAGLRSYRGDVVGDAGWEPIIDRATHERLAAKARTQARTGSDRGRPAARLLSGILVCSSCKAPMWTATRGDFRVYRCAKRPGSPGCGRVTIIAPQTDELVTEMVLYRLSSPHLHRARKASRRGRLDTDRLAEKLAEAEERLSVLASSFAVGEIGRREWQAGRDAAQKTIAELRRSLERESSGTVIAGLPSGEAALRAAWAEKDVDWRRAVIRSVVERVEVAPATRRGRGYDPERVKPFWR